MKRLGAALLLCAWCSLGCFQIPDDWSDTDLVNALDYRIDRPRVLGIKFNPPYTHYSVPIEIEALVVAPDKAIPTSVSVDVCGLNTQRPVSVWDVNCFNNTAYVTHLSQELTFSWQPPHFAGLGCDDDTGWVWEMHCTKNRRLECSRRLQ
ncbi:MAG: hypothetical protein HN348_08135 [Proteobacteria bacterium]|jgi:hypothetical protein|nr:hypothetical protein [Pseudomonadota bacterium]